ncbi:hypothetical protein Tco_0764695 [Tanacetum coccineum]
MIMPASTNFSTSSCIALFLSGAWLLFFCLTATLILSSIASLVAECCTFGPKTMLHSSGMILLLRNVSTPPGTGNFNILQAVDATDWILLTPGLPIIPLYGDSDLTTAKSIQAEVECSLINA